MPDFIVGVIKNLQPLNPVHTGQPIVCWLSGWYVYAEWIFMVAHCDSVGWDASYYTAYLGKQVLEKVHLMLQKYNPN